MPETHYPIFTVIFMVGVPGTLPPTHTAAFPVTSKKSRCAQNDHFNQCSLYGGKPEFILPKATSRSEFHQKKQKKRLDQEMEGAIRSRVYGVHQPQRPPQNNYSVPLKQLSSKSRPCTNNSQRHIDWETLP